jgi:uncharacterized protein (UPF0335 family)
MTEGVGHNSVGVDQLRQYIERAERLIEERKGINDDIKDVMAEAKSQGYDTRTIREVIRQRAMDKAVRDERRELVETYLSALGLL